MFTIYTKGILVGDIFQVHGSGRGKILIPSTLQKRLGIFPSLAVTPLTILSLAGNIKLFLARESLVNDIPVIPVGKISC